MNDIIKLGLEMQESYESVTGANDTDDAAMYTEFTERTIPLCQQVKERAGTVAPSDSEIVQVHRVYQDNMEKYLNALTEMVSALDNQDAGQLERANELFGETIDLANRYDQRLAQLAEERNVTSSI